MNNQDKKILKSVNKVIDMGNELIRSLEIREKLQKMNNIELYEHANDHIDRLDPAAKEVFKEVLKRWNNEFN